MNATTETTQLNDTNVEKEKSTFMWRTRIISTLFGVGVVFSFFFSTPNSRGINTRHSTNLVRARNNEQSLLGNNDVSGTPENVFDIYLYENRRGLIIGNNNQQRHEISAGKTFGGFSVKQTGYGQSYISVVADRHKTHAVATSFCQKSPINNIGTRITHTGYGGDYPHELNFWVQFDTLDFMITNKKSERSRWTILNFVVGQGNGGGDNNWWYGAPSCTTEVKEGKEEHLVCETTNVGHYLVFQPDYEFTHRLYVQCRVGLNSKTDKMCTDL